MKALPKNLFDFHEVKLFVLLFLQISDYLHFFLAASIKAKEVFDVVFHNIFSRYELSPFC